MESQFLGYKNIVESPKIKQIENLSYEISLVLYLRNNVYWGLEEYDQKGDAEGVNLPPISTIIEGCRINQTNMIILIHNHPYVYGRCSPKPSKLDISTTKRYYAWLHKVGIRLLDHIILSPEGYCSFIEQKIPFDINRKIWLVEQFENILRKLVIKRGCPKMTDCQS